MEVIIGIIAFLGLWAVCEFILMLASSYDDFGENAFPSFIFAVVGFIIIAIAFGTTIDDKPTEQDTQLTEQWSGDTADKVVEETFGYKKKPTEELAPLPPMVQPLEPLEHKKEVVEKTQIIPSNTSYIEGSRRNYETTVVYNHETREACDNDNCFNVRLIQHTDGSFWACKRNYGVCYEYQ